MDNHAKLTCRDYAIDGVIFHSNKSCVPIRAVEIKRELEKQLNIPSVIIDAENRKRSQGTAPALFPGT
ncbi:MAG: 2-hydroxyacyl-CoA dehydratase family protein [Desulfobacteraceae bacterium]|jgi:benzoyl-CoA reductase/2-hydroxyglutaryl-CoA dehydratase subunit BcrC/BadD/HgdB|nr:2-hydroxyacyl-CoA dehydratase family protein [Desulfobacteraceae bacterium]